MLQIMSRSTDINNSHASDISVNHDTQRWLREVRAMIAPQFDIGHVSTDFSTKGKKPIKWGVAESVLN